MNVPRARRLVAIPDTHFPWASRRGLAALYAFVREFKPDAVVQLGDLYDFFCFGRYPKSLSVMTPALEVKRARAGAAAMWREIARIVPKARRYQIFGNHDDRLGKRVKEALPEVCDVPGIDLGRGLWDFEGVTTVHDSSEELFFGSGRGAIAVTHGHRKFGEHARFNQTSTINGHLHTGAVAWYRNRFGPYFELNAGFMGEIDAPVFRYRSQKRIHTSTVGVGYVDERGPRFVPL